ncbi:MAG: hypothetical protein NTV86_02660 [Planctomycetota bacterium]|nr:hypothetical protein [Planctomycetota bacterium]
MRICVIAEKTPTQVAETVLGFSIDYRKDWEVWLTTTQDRKAREFGRILRKWQATRPYPMRRPRSEAQHAPPFLDDLIEEAEPHLQIVRNLTLVNMHRRTESQVGSLLALWRLFANLPFRGQASCVGITKAIMLLTDGRLGPALDANVRRGLQIPRICDPNKWILLLSDLGSDVRVFEEKNDVSLAEVIPPQLRHLGQGRILDMILGPRD